MSRAEAEMSDTCAFDDLWIVEQYGGMGKFAEEADALPEQHGCQLDGDLVDQVELECLWMMPRCDRRAAAMSSRVHEVRRNRVRVENLEAEDVPEERQAPRSLGQAPCSAWSRRVPKTTAMMGLTKA